MDKNVVRLQDKLWIMKRIIRPLHHSSFLCIIVAAPSVMEFPQLIIRPGLEQDFSTSKWLLPIREWAINIIIISFCFKGPNKSQYTP